MKTYTLHFAALQTRGYAFNSFAHAQEIFSWRSLAYKKCVCALAGILFRIFLCWRSQIFLIRSFALMQKNQKIEAVMPSLKMDCVSLKCPNSPAKAGSNSGHFLTLPFIHFFTLMHQGRLFAATINTIDFVLAQLFSAAMILLQAFVLLSSSLPRSVYRSGYVVSKKNVLKRTFVRDGSAGSP